MVRLLIRLCLTALLFCNSACLLFGFPKLEPVIPSGYSAETVLRVNYGKSFGEVGVDWGNNSQLGEYSEPVSVEQLHIVGECYYLYDNTDGKIKLFQSPGGCIWQSSTFGNMSHYTVSPQGLVFIVWGSSHEELSCVDNAGKTLWTKNLNDILSPEEYQRYGFAEIITWSDIEWTYYGLTATFCVSPKGGGQKYLLFALSNDGTVNKLLTDSCRSIGSGGTFYSKKDTWKGDQSAKRAIVRDKNGKDVGEISFEFNADNGKYLAGKDMRMFRLKPDASGDFFVEGKATLDQTYSANDAVRGIIQEVLWRFNNQGKFKEQWRFLRSQFRHLEPEVTVGPNGSVYHLQFDDAGIEVVRYSRGRQ